MNQCLILYQKQDTMFNTECKVNFFDADPAGIIFYASLFKFSHAAYEELLKSLKTERDYFFDSELVLPIVHAEADYLKPIKAGDILNVNVHVSRLLKSSFELTYTFELPDRSIAAKAKTVHVAVSKNSFTKAYLPEDLYSGLSKHSAG